MNTKYGVPYSTPCGPPHIAGPHSLFGEHACSHVGHHVLGQFSEPNSYPQMPIFNSLQTHGNKQFQQKTDMETTIRRT